MNGCHISHLPTLPLPSIHPSFAPSIQLIVRQELEPDCIKTSQKYVLAICLRDNNNNNNVFFFKKKKGNFRRNYSCKRKPKDKISMSQLTLSFSIRTFYQATTAKYQPCLKFTRSGGPGAGLSLFFFFS